MGPGERDREHEEKSFGPLALTRRTTLMGNYFSLTSPHTRATNHGWTCVPKGPRCSAAIPREGIVVQQNNRIKCQTDMCCTPTWWRPLCRLTFFVFIFRSQRFNRTLQRPRPVNIVITEGCRQKQSIGIDYWSQPVWYSKLVLVGGKKIITENVVT